MGPFIIIALIILLILIVLSVCVYPFICASIATSCKRYSGIVTGFLLLLTIALYLFACTTLEYSFDNWCYSVYAGVVLTPIALYICTGLEEPNKWPESGNKPMHSKITIPILTFITSFLFTIEGGLRMAHSYSVHRMLNYGWGNSEADSYRFYYEEFQYAGSLLFFVSLFSALIIGVSFFSNYKENKRKLAKKARFKAQNLHDKMNEEAKPPISDIIIGNKDIIPKNKQFAEMTSPKQYVAIVHPKTLKDCFCDIILTSGIEILSDKNIVNIIGSVYKEVDIKEYKSVLDRMVNDNFLYQFVETDKQNDFALYNLTCSYARQKKVNAQKALFITQALVSAIKKLHKVSKDKF